MVVARSFHERGALVLSNRSGSDTPRLPPKNPGSERPSIRRSIRPHPLKSRREGDEACPRSAAWELESGTGCRSISLPARDDGGKEVFLLMKIKAESPPMWSRKQIRRLFPARQHRQPHLLLESITRPAPPTSAPSSWPSCGAVSARRMSLTMWRTVADDSRFTTRRS